MPSKLTGNNNDSHSDQPFAFNFSSNTNSNTASHNRKPYNALDFLKR
jgi:hypothetical protein